MNSAKTFLNISIKSLPRSTLLELREGIGSLQFRCQDCYIYKRNLFICSRQRRKSFHSFRALSTSSFGLLSKNQSWTLNDNASPQGIQGDIDSGDARFKLWMENCNRYGLANCDEQLEGIQRGRKTIGEVISEQEALISSIAEEYRRQSAKRAIDSAQTAAHVDVSLPDIEMPCPQGVQGEDCARFKLWLENCHQFRFSNCVEQLDHYSKGRKTLAQLFEEQDKIIKEAASAIYLNKTLTQEGGKQDTTETTTKESTGEETSTGPLTAKQKLKNAVKVYGSTVIVFHVSISIMSLGFFYTLVSSGIDVVGILTKLGIGESIIQSKLATGTGTFVVAYAVHKVFAPARIAITVTCTPLIVRYLRRIGILKATLKE